MSTPATIPAVRTTAVPTAVTVYQQKAQVMRTAEDVSLPGPCDEMQLLIPIPTFFDRDTIQVHFDTETAKHVVLRGVMFEEEDPVKDAAGTDGSALEKLKTELKEVEEKLKKNEFSMEAEKGRKEMTESLFKKVCGPATEASPAVTDSKFWETQLTNLEVTSTNSRKAQRLLQKEEKALKKECNLLQRKVNQLENVQRFGSPDSEKTVYVVIVLKVLEAISAGMVHVSYVVEGSWWEASYDATLNTEAKTLTINYNGLVHCHCPGEKLADVWLTLSSAAPRIHGKPPKLEPWRVSVKKNTPEPLAAAAPPLMMKANCMMAMSAVMPEADFCIQDAQVEEGAGMVTFTLPTKQTLDEESGPLRVPLTTLTFPADITYTAAAGELEAAFARATSTNKSEYLLLPGSAAIFLDGDFVADSFLARTGAGDKIEIDFGPDSTVEVQRKLVKKHCTSDKAGLFVRAPKMTTRYEYTTTVTNKKKAEKVTLTLRERIPRSQEEKLVVRLTAPKLKTEHQQRELEVSGFVEEILQLVPGEKKTWTLSYEVEAPAGSHIFGMDG